MPSQRLHPYALPKAPPSNIIFFVDQNSNIWILEGQHSDHSRLLWSADFIRNVLKQLAQRMKNFLKVKCSKKCSTLSALKGHHEVVVRRQNSTLVHCLSSPQFVNTHTHTHTHTHTLVGIGGNCPLQVVNWSHYYCSLLSKTCLLHTFRLSACP